MFNVTKFKKLKLKNYKINEKLKNHTTFQIGGCCFAFVIAQNLSELKKTIKFCLNESIKYLILGCGSNVLFEDVGFNGVVITLSENFLKKTVKSNKTTACLSVCAGEKLSKLNLFCAQHGLSGLEWSFGIPATIGGAICSNAGSFNCEISSIIKKVKVLHIKRFLWFNLIKTKTLKHKQCYFSYRNSVFKKGGFIILGASLVLQKSTFNKVFSEMNKCCKIKKQTQPLGTKNAGCIFKNGKNYKAALLIENLKLKGKSVGDAQISTKHSNFIINNANASCQNVKDLINYIQNKVLKRFGVLLELEIELIKEGEKN